MNQIEKEAEAWFVSTYGPLRVDGITMCCKAFLAGAQSRDARIAEVMDAVQKHAESGNIENYGYLSDKLEAILKQGGA